MTQILATTRSPIEKLKASGIKSDEQGRIPWRTAIEAYPMALHEAQRLERLSAHCFRFLEAVACAVRDQTALGQHLCNELGTPRQSIALVQAASRHGMPPVTLVRPDIVLGTDGRMSVVEIETLVGGLGMCAAFDQAYPIVGFEGVARLYAQMVRDLVVRQYGRAKRTAPQRLTVGVASPAVANFYDWEFPTLARYIAAYNINLTLGRPDDITIRNNREVWMNGMRLDLIFRFFAAAQLADAARGTLQKIAEKQYVPLAQPWIELLDEKALLALLHDESFKQLWIHALGQDVYQELIEHVPRSTIVGRDNGLLRKLYAAPAKDRPYWLKKSSNTWGGRKAFFGQAVSNTKWRSASEEAWSGYLRGELWIIQEHAPGRQESILCADTVREGVAELTGSGRYNPFVFWTNNGPRLANIRITARHNHKVHGATDATFAPITISER